MNLSEIFALTSFALFQPLRPAHPPGTGHRMVLRGGDPADPASQPDPDRVGSAGNSLGFVA